MSEIKNRPLTEYEKWLLKEIAENAKFVYWDSRSLFSDENYLDKTIEWLTSDDDKTLYSLAFRYYLIKDLFHSYEKHLSNLIKEESINGEEKSSKIFNQCMLFHLEVKDFADEIGAPH